MRIKRGFSGRTEEHNANVLSFIAPRHGGLSNSSFDSRSHTGSEHSCILFLGTSPTTKVTATKLQNAIYQSEHKALA